jgi:hypothetical protein
MVSVGFIYSLIALQATQFQTFVNDSRCFAAKSTGGDFDIQVPGYRNLSPAKNVAGVYEKSGLGYREEDFYTELRRPREITVVLVVSAKVFGGTGNARKTGSENTSFTRQ